MKQSVYFIGVGGIGMSALARYFLSLGYNVGGSDLTNSPIIDQLKKEGIKAHIGHQIKNLKKQNPNLVVYSQAVEKQNPELKAAKKLGMKLKSYAEALGELTNKYRAIAIAGSHGKSTTTALTSLILSGAGLNPTVILGTKLKQFGGSNFRKGRGRWLVLEADEWKGSFWNYYPEVAVITNIDKEHLDFYKNYAGVKRGFQQFVKNIRSSGRLFVKEEFAPVIESACPVPITKFGIDHPTVKKIKKIIKIPGEHNLLNALAAYLVARYLKISEKKILRAIGRYQGAWRRFEYKGKLNSAPVYDDYGHHPTEIKATLSAAREKFPQKRIWCVFQPHQRQRTNYLFKDFSSAFGIADKVVLLDVYSVAGREKTKFGQKANSRKLANLIKEKGVDAVYVPSMKSAARLLKENIGPGDVALIMGAGDVWKLTNSLQLAVDSK